MKPIAHKRSYTHVCKKCVPDTHELKAAKVLFNFHILRAPFMKPIAHKRSYTHVCQKMCAGKVWCQKNLNLPDLFIGEK